MKNKKLSGIFALLLSVCLAITTFSFLGAKADGETTYDAEKTVIAAMKYDLADLYEGATAIKSVKKADGTAAVNGTDPERDKTAAADYWYGSVSKEDDKEVLKDGDDVIFNYVAENAVYSVELNVKAKSGDGMADVSKTVKVTVTDKTDKTPEFDLSKIDSVKAAVSNVKVDSDKKFVLPAEIWNLLKDDVNYPLGKVTAKIYVSTPGSGWSSSYATSGKKSSSSSLKITVSNAGTYYFYVLFSVQSYDPIKGGASKELTTEKNSEWKELAPSGENRGFYAVEKDAEGAEVKTLKIPVFSFDYNPEAVVEIKEKISVQTGKVGMSYSSLSFTVENYIKSECELMYAPLNSTDWVKASNSKAENATSADVKNAVAEYDEKALKNYSSGASVTFTPLKTGQFKVVCKAMGANSETPVEYTSSIITVRTEMVIRKAENTAVRDFFKNNTLAVVFLGIAVLCLIAIIVIACWKPKDGKPAAKVEDVKAEKKADKVDAPAVVEADDAENTDVAEDTSAADAADEETQAEAAEVDEVAPETAEEAVESSDETAPAEETAEAAAPEAAPEEETATDAPADDAPKAE